MSKKVDYKSFGEHLQEYEEKGIPIGMNDLIRLAKIYNTPIPRFKDGEIFFK